MKAEQGVEMEFGVLEEQAAARRPLPIQKHEFLLVLLHNLEKNQEQTESTPLKNEETKNN